MRPNARRRSRYSVIPKMISVQIISPGLTLIRKSPSLAKGSRRAGIGDASLGDEEGDERHEQRVERDRLGQRQAEEHEAQQVAAQLGLAGDTLDRLADQVAHA